MRGNSVEGRIERVVSSPLFPFTSGVGDQAESLILKPLSDLMANELPRDGEDGRPCHSCGRPEKILWTNGRWQITSMQPSPNPVLLFLETVEHVDFEHLDAAMAAEFGVLSWRLEAAMRSLDSVGRVHINRWGDGSSHFHVWFQARPARQLEFYGWGNALWSQVAEPLPVEVLAANQRDVLDRFERSLQ